MENLNILPLQKQPRFVVIVSGLSGSGKTVFMRALEDLGFYCVDNLPVPLISTFLKFAFQSNTSFIRIALGIDSRGEQFLNDFINEIEDLRNYEGKYFQLRIVFLQSSEQVLLKRFQETRRKHPLAEGISVLAAIEKEKILLTPLKNLADIVFDTDTCNIHQLRKWVLDSFSSNQPKIMLVQLVSFGFKFGVPAESNIVCDLRFLPNPYFVSGLKPLTGRDREVYDYLFSQNSVVEYWDRLKSFLEYSIFKYYEEGRFFVNVAIGCTGGKHRSVVFVEKLGLQPWKNVSFIINHRDIDKDI